MNYNFKFIDLFAGIGGFRLALEKFNGDCVFSSEKDKYCQQTYEKNFGEKPAGNIKNILASEIPKHDVLCAGFPCQSFSISGKKRGFEDTRGTLFYEIARIAKYHQPAILFLENVKHLVNHDNGETFEVIEETLKDIGYDLYYKIINSSFFGIPQSRKRVFIVCFREDLDINNFEFPEGFHKKVKLKDILLDDDKKIQKHIKDVGVKWKEKKYKNDLFDDTQLKPVRIGTINKGGQGERVYSINGHAITLSAYGGGVFSKTGGYKVGNKVRKLAPRECARLMGFPDDFEIPVSDSQAYKQFGNSVVVPVVEKIFSKIVNTGIFKKSKKSKRVSKIRSKTMKAIKSKDTSLENKVRSAVWNSGIRFRKNVTDLKGKPDIAIKKYKIVIFIDSCFWHGCSLHCRMPKSNKEYWENKIVNNIKRDQEVTNFYKEEDWNILRIWEHDLEENFEDKIKEIIEFIENSKLKLK